MNKINLFLIAFITATIILFLIFKISELVSNILLRALIFSFILTAIFITLISKKLEIKDFSGTKLRYSLACKDCSWEWMSHTTDELHKPTHCPNCNSDKIEVLGVRRVKYLKDKSNIDLRNFFK